MSKKRLRTPSPPLLNEHEEPGIFTITRERETEGRNDATLVVENYGSCSRPSLINHKQRDMNVVMELLLCSRLKLCTFLLKIKGPNVIEKSELLIFLTYNVRSPRVAKFPIIEEKKPKSCHLVAPS